MSKLRKLLIEDLETEIEEDFFDSLEDKFEKIELLRNFKECGDVEKCPFCEYGKNLDTIDSEGEFWGNSEDCSHCLGIGYVPTGRN